MLPIITSLLDNDLYKITMMNFVLELFPNVEVEYRFKNRGEHKFNDRFLYELKNQIKMLSKVCLQEDEYKWMKENIPYLTPGFMEYFRNFQFNPDNVIVYLDDDDNLVLSIKGLWRDTILYEVPLMAIISELYFDLIDNEWKKDKGEELYHGIYLKARSKSSRLNNADCTFVDFGTRRRRSRKVQDTVIRGFYDCNLCKKFIGTSNVYFAMKWGIKAIGTYAHEIPQAMQSLESVNHCNYYAMYNWIKIFGVSLGIALTDTITTDMFLKNFNERFAKLFDGVRHDSSCPFKFMDKIVDFYRNIGIDPTTKTIVFSDGLNVDKAIKIREYCNDKIKCSFGIGTHMTNDFENSPALNMVIKLWSVNNFPVVKLSDVEGKENGDPEAVSFMKWLVKHSV